jgi:ABC-type transport system involved in cytochrome bd biosynthesis fused ATPase/permease subunit
MRRDLSWFSRHCDRGEGEKAIQELFREKAIAMIAHRLKTLINSDIIYFINRGRIKDNGKYEELERNYLAFRTMTMK